MKPYSYRQLTKEKQIFNYRLSRERRVVEHAFGILSQRFRVFGKAIPLSPEKAQVIVMAACCLHNFLLRSRMSADCYMQDTSGCDTATGMVSMSKQGRNRYAVDAGTVRDKWKKCSVMKYTVQMNLDTACKTVVITQCVIIIVTFSEWSKKITDSNVLTMSCERLLKETEDDEWMNACKNIKHRRISTSSRRHQTHSSPAFVPPFAIGFSDYVFFSAPLSLQHHTGHKNIST